MSHYVVGKTVYRDFGALCDTLTELFGQGSVERTSRGTNDLEAQGYQGDSRTREIGKVAAIVRRKYVGASSNDVPIRREADGTYRLILSDYDSAEGSYTGSTPAISRKLGWDAANRA